MYKRCKRIWYRSQAGAQSYRLRLIALMFIVKGTTHATFAPLPPARGVTASWIVHGGRQGLLDDGDQALIRVLVTAFPFICPGLAVSSGGHRFKTGL